jgi:hypothetical protein
MEKNNCLPAVFTDLSSEENLQVLGGTSFAYDVGRVLRFLGISAQGAHGPSFAIADWIGTSFLMEE